MTQLGHVARLPQPAGKSPCYPATPNRFIDAKAARLLAPSIFIGFGSGGGHVGMAFRAAWGLLQRLYCLRWPVRLANRRLHSPRRIRLAIVGSTLKLNWRAARTAPASGLNHGGATVDGITRKPRARSFACIKSCMGEKSSVFGLAEKQNGKMNEAANLGGLIFNVRFYCANSTAGSSRCSIDRHRY